MTIDIGSYVKEHLFDQVYRYGIVVGVGEGDFTDIIKVVWTPRKEHPVAFGPYPQAVLTSKLEVVCE
jgi:hypothetical protein